MVKRYSLCKHGPCCSRYGRGQCGFAHKLDEVCLPEQTLYAFRWVDDTHKEKGHPGIDFFLGQTYTFAQHCRVLSYVARGDHIPDWANRYLWFIGHPVYQPRSEMDLGLHREVCLHAKSVMPPGCGIPECVDAMELLQRWKAPFQYAVDAAGRTFKDRLRSRIENGRYGDLCFPLENIDYSVDEYIQKTGMRWGRYSRSYLRFSKDERFIKLGVSIGTGEGWAWVARYEPPRQYGWVPDNYLAMCDERVFSDDFVEGILEMQNGEEEYVEPNPDVPYNLARTAPDGTDLTVHSNLAVCISDGSWDSISKDGYGVSSVCMLPTGVCQWETPATFVSMVSDGATTSELVGIALSLASLLRSLALFDCAVVYSDSLNTLRYIGDHTTFLAKDPPPGNDLSGWKLYPLILYCRRQMDKLRVEGKTVFTKHLPSGMNPADKLAFYAMREGRRQRWPEQERIPLIDDVSGLRDVVVKVGYLTRELLNGRLTLQTVLKHSECSVGESAV